MQEKSEQLDAEVIILGAGAAGLAAAAELDRAGVRCCIVEARDRLGGRILTLRRQGFDYPIELGAEFVHGRAPAIFNVLDGARMVAVDISQRHFFQAPDGKITPSDEYWHEVDEILGGMEEVDRDQSFADYLNEKFSGERWKQAREAALSYVQGFNAAHADKIGVKGLAIQEKAEEELGETQFRLISGYDSLVDFLAGNLQQTEILLSTVAKTVSWTRAGVTVSVLDHTNQSVRELRGRCALITVPLGVLKAKEDSVSGLRFCPVLPEKVDAMNYLEMGPVARNVFLFDTRFWEQVHRPHDFSGLGFISNRSCKVPTWWTQLPVRVPLLVGWTAGAMYDANFNGAKPETIIEEALNSLSKILGISRSEIESHLVESYTHDWGKDSFSLGAYSYAAANGVPAQKKLAETVEQTLFFAGEATNYEGNCGTVHGAMDTAKRAAKEILEVVRAG